MTVKIHLVVADGEHRGRVIPVLGPRYRIGRDATCQLRPASERVSRWHCEIVVEEESILVRDLGSTNGTFVNETELRETEAPLNDGDWLEVGPLLFCVRIKSSGATGINEPTPAPTSEATVNPTLSEPEEADEPVSDGPTHAHPPITADFLPPAPLATGSQAAAAPSQPRPTSAGPSGPPTIRRKARPPASGDGMSKVADDLLKKLSRKPGQPPSRPT